MINDIYRKWENRINHLSAIKIRHTRVLNYITKKSLNIFAEKNGKNS